MDCQCSNNRSNKKELTLIVWGISRFWQLSCTNIEMYEILTSNRIKISENVRIWYCITFRPEAQNFTREGGRSGSGGKTGAMAKILHCFNVEHKTDDE